MVYDDNLENFSLNSIYNDGERLYVSISNKKRPVLVIDKKLTLIGDLDYEIPKGSREPNNILGKSLENFLYLSGHFKNGKKEREIIKISKEYLPSSSTISVSTVNDDSASSDNSGIAYDKIEYRDYNIVSSDYKSDAKKETDVKIRSNLKCFNPTYYPVLLLGGQ